MVSAVASDVTEEINLTLDEGQIADSLDMGAALSVAVQQVASSTQPVLVLSGFESLEDSDWVSLNFLRSRLVGDHTLVFVMGRRALLKLQERAPDLDSLLNGSTWQLDTQADTLRQAVAKILGVTEAMDPARLAQELGILRINLLQASYVP